VTLPISGAKIDKLGVRLRDAENVETDDLAQLQALLLAYSDALAAVAEQLRSNGLAPTTRLKTSGTIIDKLRRESPITLRSIHDLAGARVVQPMTLDDQDKERDRIVALWPDAKVIDRRETPSHGYRAVHVIPRVDGCWVEIQLRTRYQNAWAQVTETLADMWGRQVRYGGEPDGPEERIFDEPHTRSQAVAGWIAASERIAALEQLENLRGRFLNSMTEDELARLDAQIDQGFGQLRASLTQVREAFGLP